MSDGIALNKRQKAVYDFIVAANSPVSIDEVIEILWPDQEAKNGRTVCAAFMRLLCARTSAMPVKIVRSTPLGRKSIARYAAVSQ